MEEEGKTAARSTVHSIGWKRFFHFEWIRMPMGLLKLVEFVIVIIALAIMGGLRSTAGTGYSSIEFFYFVHSAALIMIIMTLIMYIANIFHRLPTILISNLVWTVICSVGSLMLLISAAVVMDKYSGNDTILAAGSFGIIAFFLFLFESAFYFIKWRNHGPYATSSVTAVIGYTADAVATAEQVSAY